MTTFPDPEALRREYNDHYRNPVDHWSCHQPDAAREIVTLVSNALRTHSFRPNPGASVLDVGCAKGHITEAFRSAGFEAHGLDYSDVAVTTAKQLFPACTFHHGDGLNPRFSRQFDLIFMRGFSGCNTLEMSAVSTLANRYLELLRPNGFFVLGYSTDFSGQHRPGDTACWNRAHLQALRDGVRAELREEVMVPTHTPLRSLKMRLSRMLGRRPKYYLYLFFSNAAPARTTG